MLEVLIDKSIHNINIVRVNIISIGYINIIRIRYINY